MPHFQALRYLAQRPKQLAFSDYTERLRGSDLEYVLNYTSNVTVIKSGSVRYFFKEAKERPGSVGDCVKNGVCDFFDRISPNPSLEKRVMASLENKGNLRRIVNMGYKDKPRDGFHRYLVSGDESCLGLPSPESEDDKRQLRRLVFYLYGELQNWFYNVGVREGELQTFSASRALATRELAGLLGLEELTVRCEFVKLELGGRVRYGLLSEEAFGESVISSPPEKRASLVSPQLLCSLTNLNLLDALTGDTDHRVGNYNVALGTLGKYSAVVSYDNDGPEAFALSTCIRRKNVIGCSPFISCRGAVYRPHLDKAAAEKLLKIQRSDLSMLEPYLGSLQLWCLWRRIKSVQAAVRKTARIREDFLLEADEWKKEHIREDASGKYGKTYLASLLSDCYYETGFHNFDTL